MRLAFLLPASVALGAAGVIVAERMPVPAFAGQRLLASAAGVARSVTAGAIVAETLTGVRAYTDPELAFDMAVPAGWMPIALVDSPAPSGIGQAGHAVGFEAPRDGSRDAFADYVMVEILPDRDSGLFLTDGSRLETVEIDGIAGIRDSLVIEGHEVDGVGLDLVVHQARIHGPGWTIGFYAIGESHRAGLVADAFELMIRTFHLPAPPFRVV